MDEAKVQESSLKRAKTRIATFVLALVVAFSMTMATPVSAFATPVTEDGVTIDKTATLLNEDDQTTVTLNVGGEQHEENVAVVFVLDYSTSVNVRNAAADMLKELASKDNTNIKACVIDYNSEADAPRWVSINEDTDTKELLTADREGGTNYHAGLLSAKKALESNEISGYETYLITISDGITYLWTDESTGMTKSVWYQNRGNGQNDIQNTNSVYDMKYSNQAIPEDTFNSLVNGDDSAVSKYNNTVKYFDDYPGTKPQVTEAGKYLSFNNADYESVRANYLIGPEIALYKTAGVWKSLVDEVDHSYAFKMDEGHWASYPYGEQLMNWMIGEASDGGSITDSTAEKTFQGISNNILYSIASGSVTDIVGNNFDLTGLDSCTLKVGNDELEGVVEGNTIYFGEEQNGQYPYSVEYNPNAENGEQLIWNINVPVEHANPIQLSYDLTLSDKKSVPGEYEVKTNELATLNYTPTNGSEVVSKTFPVPTVTYTVEEAPVSPATPDNGNNNTNNNTQVVTVNSDTPDAGEGLPKTGDSVLPFAIAFLAVIALAGATGVVAWRKSH